MRMWSSPYSTAGKWVEHLDPQVSGEASAQTSTASSILTANQWACSDEQILQLCIEDYISSTIKVDKIVRSNPLRSQHFEKMTPQILYAFNSGLQTLMRF
ncbi:hypothetical protein Q9966_010058 [Columba livia]|nr:hypothetical protein Q9966_010058 [Columba livia]